MQGIRILGFKGTIKGESRSGEVFISFKSTKEHETLSLSFEDAFQVIVNFDKVEALVSRVRSKFPKLSFIKDGFVEEEVETTGLFDSGGLNLTKGSVNIAYRSNSKLDMLSIAFEDRGEISVPFTPIEILVKEVRK